MLLRSCLFLELFEKRTIVRSSHCLFVQQTVLVFTQIMQHLPLRISSNPAFFNSKYYWSRFRLWCKLNRLGYLRSFAIIRLFVCVEELFEFLPRQSIGMCLWMLREYLLELWCHKPPKNYRKTNTVVLSKMYKIIKICVINIYTTRKLSDTCHPYRKRLNRCHVWQGEYS